MRSITAYSTLVLAFIFIGGCSEVSPFETGPDLPVDGEPVEHEELVAFTIYYHQHSVIAVAPLSDLGAYKVVSPQDLGFYDNPRFSPSKSKLVFSNPSGVTFLYDLTTDTLVTPKDDNGHIRGSVKARTRNIVWNQDEREFLYRSGPGSITEPWDVRRYSFEEERSREIYPLALTFAIDAETVVVRGGYPPGVESAPQLHFLDTSTRELTAINNPYLQIPSCIKPCSPRIVEGFDWNPDKKLVAVAIRELDMDWWKRRLVITDLTGSIVEILTHSNSHIRRPRWGHSNLLYFDIFSSDDDYRSEKNGRLLSVDIVTGKFEEILSRSAFLGATGVGSVDI